MLKEEVLWFDVGAARYGLLVCLVKLLSCITTSQTWADWESAYRGRFGSILVGDIDHIRVAISLLQLNAVLVAVMALGIIVIWRWRLRIVPMNFDTLCLATVLAIAPEIVASRLVALFLSAVQTKCSQFLDYGDLEFIHQKIALSNQSTAISSALVLILFSFWMYRTFFSQSIGIKE